MDCKLLKAVAEFKRQMSGANEGLSIRLPKGSFLDQALDLDESKQEQTK